MEIETEELSPVDKTILKLCRQHPAGLNQEKLHNEMEGVKMEAIVESINRLLAVGAIAVFKEPGLGLVYKEANPQDVAKLKGLTSEDRLIYQLIEASSNRGIWVRDLRMRSNLQQVQINKILKTLEGKRLIKSVKSVASKTRKVYMLYDLEPHVDITGDIWYSESEIDSEFIAILNRQCYTFILQKGYVSSEEVTAWVRKSGLSKVELRIENIQSILDTLIYDGKIETIDDPRGPSFLGGKSAVLYKPTKLEVVQNGFTSTPCGICPVFRECSDKGDISPITCIYLKNWLE